MAYTRAYKDEANLYKQIDNVMNKMMSEYGVAIDREYMIQLTLQGRYAKSLSCLLYTSPSPRD